MVGEAEQMTEAGKNMNLAEKADDSKFVYNDNVSLFSPSASRISPKSPESETVG